MSNEIKFKDVDSFFKGLELKEYPLTFFVDKICEIVSLQKQGLFADCPRHNSIVEWKDKFYSELEELRHPETKEQINLLDCKVDLTYQRLLRLKKIVEHLLSPNVHGADLKFDKMCAGAIDIAIRPEGGIFIWDGFRRAILALINGIRFPKYSICAHQKGLNDDQCRAIEAYAFKKRNGDNEPMSREELYKSCLQFDEPKALKTKAVLRDCKLDVLRTIPNAKISLDGFAEFEDSIHKEKILPKHLITASRVLRKSWKEDSTISSYLLCGLATYIQLEDSGKLSWANNITGLTGCDITPLLVKFAVTNKQTSLVKNRISKFGIQTIAMRVAYRALGVKTVKDQTELAEALEFDEEGIRQIVVVAAVETNN